MKRLPGIVFLFCISSVVSPFHSYAEKPKYGPEGTPLATPLVAAPEFFKNPKNNSSAFWPLISHYRPQVTGASCSSASLAMVLNAARGSQSRSASDANITEKMLWEKVNVDHWSDRMSEGGYQGKYGADLAMVAKVSEAAFKAYGFPDVVVTMNRVNDLSPKTKAQLIADLKKLSAKNHILANFDQKKFTDDAEVGHFAPLAAFDPISNRVLVLDPDREYYEPYWISVDTLLSGMNTVDSGKKENRGYLLIQTSR